MARPESQATAGYFPTPEHLVPAIASLLTVEVDPLGRPLFFDPCAGAGAAVLTLASAVLDLPRREAARHSIGIEMEGSRFVRLERQLEGGVAHRGDAFQFAISAQPGASVLFLNPPYDTDPDHQRMEQRFLARFTQALAPGGALVYVVPGRTLEASAEFLASHYTEIELWRFPEPDFSAFGQVVVVAERRGEPIPPDRFTLGRLRAAAGSAEDLPPLPEPEEATPRTFRVARPYLGLERQAIDVQGLLERQRPFADSASLLGFDRDARELLGAPLPVALPARPAHIALALASGLLNGRHLVPNGDVAWLPRLLAKGTFSRRLLTVETRRNKDGRVTGEVCVQHPRLDIHVLRLDTLTFHQLALGTEPSGATSVEDFNTADLLACYSDSLARLVREQLPALHDPENPDHQIELPELARKPFRRQAQLIQAGLKLLARDENPQTLAEVGTGKTTVALSIAAALSPRHFQATASELARVGFDPSRLRPVRRVLVVCPPHLLDGWRDQVAAVLPDARVVVVRGPSDLDRPAEIYILSREVAKLGSTVAGVRGPRCPDCGHPVPEASVRVRASRRLTCDGEVVVPEGRQARQVRDLGIALYRFVSEETLERLLAYLAPHPAVHRQAEARLREKRPPEPFSVARADSLRRIFRELVAGVEAAFLDDSPWQAGFWRPFRAAGCLAILFGEVDLFTAECRLVAARREDEGPAAASGSLERLLAEELRWLHSEAERLEPGSLGGCDGRPSRRPLRQPPRGGDLDRPPRLWRSSPHGDTEAATLPAGALHPAQEAAHLRSPDPGRGP